MKWIRDPLLEPYLKKYRVPFKVETLTIGDIDWDLSLERQSRVEKRIDNEMMMQYAIKMEDPGANFKMILVNKLRNHAFIYSGLHRGHAWKYLNRDEASTPLECYTVSVTDPRLDEIIPRTVNTLEGKRPPKEELIAQAAWMVANLKMTAKEAAKMEDVAHEQVSAYMRTDEVMNKIREQGVSPEGIARTTFTRMSPLLDMPAVLREATKLLKKYEIRGDEANQVVDDIKEAEGERARLEVVKEWAEACEERKDKTPAPFKTANRSRFMGFVTGLDRFLGKIDSPEGLQLGEADYGVVFEKWGRIEKKLRQLIQSKVKG